jgi:hypothetical protein
MQNKTSLLILITYWLAFSSNAQPSNCPNARLNYLKDYPDVAKAGMDPWTHYQRYGIREGRIWPPCDPPKVESTNEGILKFKSGPIKIDYQNSPLNTKEAFLAYGQETDHNQKILFLQSEFKKYDSLIQLNNKFENYFSFNGVKINITDDDVKAVRYYQDKKLFYFKPEEWFKHKKKLVKLGFDPNIFLGHVNFQRCKLYFALNEDGKYYMEVPYFELQELFSNGFVKPNRINRQFNDCYLKKGFQKFLKQNPDIFVEVDEGEKNSILFKLTNIDDYEAFDYLKSVSQEIKNGISTYEMTYLTQLGDNYFYWGGKSNLKLHGLGLIVRNSNKNILTIGIWANGEPEEMLVYYLYSVNKEYQLKGKNKILHIIESPNKTNSQFYFGEYVSNYKNFGWVRNGKGDYIWNNSSYSGQWEFSERTGYGVFFNNLNQKNQTIYQGNFLLGKFNGDGAEYEINGKLLKEGVWVNGIFFKSRQQILIDQSAEEARQLKAAAEAALLTSGNFDEELESTFKDLLSIVILKKSLGHKVNTDALIDKCVVEFENNTLHHPMSIEEKKYFSAFGERKINQLSLGLSILKLGSTPASNTSANLGTNNQGRVSNAENTNNDNVYICTAGNPSECCRAVVVTSNSPKSSGCCPRTDGLGCSSGHPWRNCGKSGNKNYQCSGCGITVRTVSRPNQSCCPVNGCASMHYWSEIK